MAKHKKTGRSRPKRQPDWLVAALALMGSALTLFLVVVAYTAVTPVGCGEGSACDLIQQSRWSTLLGFPVALWGLMLYLLIGLIAVFARPGDGRWQVLWWLSFFGLAFSVYLGLVGWFQLEALCAWCTASLAVLLVMFIALGWRRPERQPEGGWPLFMGARASLVAIAVLALHGVYAGWFQPPEDPRLRALAEHLDRVGAVYYGASWCPSCQQQHRLFGRSSSRLPYVECSPQGQRGPIAFECVAAEINSYPTWIIGTRRFTSVQSPEELARLTRFDWDGFEPGD